MKNKKRPHFIILIILFLLLIVLILSTYLLQKLKANDYTVSNETNNVIISNNIIEKETKTVKEVIENSGSVYIGREENIFIEISANFKYDLFDENGKSKKTYYDDIIEEIVEIEKDTFYLKDTDKKIEIFVVYDKETEEYTVTINNIEDYYDKTNGEIYISISKAEIVEQGSFIVTNSLLWQLVNKDMYYSTTELSDVESRTKLDNGYYSYFEGSIITRLQAGKVLNALFKESYEEEIASKIYVGTPLEEVFEKYSKVSFGSVEEGYLCYRTDDLYIFIYEDEISVYEYYYKENEYFDQYLKDYCQTGDLEKLYQDFTSSWSTYFENEYNPETQSLKLSFPTRGIDIDIENNDSKGITIYNNYYLTETVKELIKSNQITLNEEKDFIYITEQARRESM